MVLRRPVYPFSAIVGQSELKLALLLNAVNPMIGGLLIRGQKGTGKSTSVRALVDILPDVTAVKGCPFNCSPTDPTNMCSDCLEKHLQGEPLEAERKGMRIVSLPIGSTEDRVIGSLDIEKAISQGVRALQPGLLAEANQNILYIDEVNLLPDHLTDSILDAAASGWNTVEREGISVQHPSRFILVGTMNPEEGELRPQILDRFGVFAETRNIEDPDLRSSVLKRNEEFISDPSNFISKSGGELEGLRSRIEAARRFLPKVEASQEVYSMVADVCSRLKVDGFRPDIVSVKVARALAAFHGRRAIALEDVTPSIELALGHRTRRSGLAPPPSPTEIHRALGKAKRRLKLRGGNTMPTLRGVLDLPREFIGNLLKYALKSLLVGAILFGLLPVSMTYLIETLRGVVSPKPPTPLTLLLEGVVGGALSFLLTRLTRRRRQEEAAVGVLDLSEMTLEASGRLSPPDRTLGIGSGGATSTVRYEDEATTTDYGLKILKPMGYLPKGLMGVKPRRIGRPIRGGGYTGGRRMRAVSSSSRGRYAWYQTPKGRPRDIALVPTLRAAAFHQPERRGGTRIVIKPGDMRVKIREYRAPFFIMLLVDMSMSMIESVGNIIQAIYSLHKQVYRRRDKVGLIVFKGSKAFTIQHPTTNLDLVVEKLRRVGASDFTPLAAGLYQAWKALKQEKLRNRDAIPNLVVVSDGIANVPLNLPSHL